MRQKQFLLLSGYLIVLISLSSCYPGTVIPDPYIVDQGRQKENLYYAPSVPNTSLLTEKNDFSTSLMLSSGTKSTAAEFQAAYVAGKHIGIIASYSFAENGDRSTDSYFMKRNRFELGSGYVTQLGKMWQFETYAGFGSGNIKNIHHTGFSKIGLTHFFLQPTIAISNEKKTAQLGFVSRFEGVNFNVTDTAFATDREPFSTSQVKSLYAQPFHIMWQPGIVFRFGWKQFLFYTGYSLSSDLTNPDLYRSRDNLFMGISVRVNTKKQKTEK